MGDRRARLAGRRGVVTGASSGIGRDIARQLAARGCDLLLVARRGDRLEELAAELRAAHGVDVEALAIDLTDPDGPARVAGRALADGRRVHVLVHNAGVGMHGPYLRSDFARVERMMRLNVHAVAELTHRLLPRMLEHGEPGHVLCVASVLGWLPVPYYACYAATKAWLRSFSEALAIELRSTPIAVTVFSAGGTATEFGEVAGQRPTPLFRALSMSSERAARSAVQAMLARRRSAVAGVLNSLFCLLLRALPRSLAAAAMTVILGTPALEESA